VVQPGPPSQAAVRRVTGTVTVVPVDCLRAAAERLVTPLRAAAASEEHRELVKAAARAGAPVQATLQVDARASGRRQKPASAAAQTTARAARAAPPVAGHGRRRACAHVGTQGATRAARTAPSSALAGRH
jgi:hypothetical protein